MPLRVGYVREHFSSPLLQFAAHDRDKTFTLVECPGGTGQVISRLTNDEVDVAIALTDAFIAGIAKGSKAYKFVGSYVSTPLNWAVITGAKSKYQSIAELEGTTIGISRVGSGSQTMAYVMAQQQGWTSDTLRFKVNNDIHGLLDSVNDGSTSAFMWEWFTTKPFVDAGQVRFIGSVPTPWPSWLIVAQSSQERVPSHELRAFLEILTAYVVSFDAPDNRAGPDVEFIKDTFGYCEEDAWLKTVRYPQNCSAIPEKVITDTLATLERAGVVSAPEGQQFDVKTFIDTSVVTLT